MTDDVEFVVAGYDHLYFGRTIPKSPKEVGVFETRRAKEAVLSLYEAGYFNMPWNKLYRKELIRAGFPTDLNLGEDLCFNLQYLQKCNRFCVIPDLVCEYIQDDRGTTLSTKRRTDKIPIAFRLFDVVRDIFGAMYGSDEQVARVLASKLTKEFLEVLLDHCHFWMISKDLHLMLLLIRGKSRRSYWSICRPEKNLQKDARVRRLSYRSLTIKSSIIFSKRTCFL